MRLLSYVLVFTGLLILQILIVPFFSVLDIAPDVVLIGVMYLAMTAGVLPALVAALLSGLIRDAFSTHFLGAHMLALVISAFITGILFKEREKLNFQVQTAYFSIIMLIHHLIYYGLFLINKKLGLFELVARFALPAAAYTLAVAGIAHFLLPRGFWR